MNNKEENFSFLYEKALNLVEDRKLKGGEEILKNLYNSGNINKDILNVLGILSYLYCDFDSAKKYWNESLEIDNSENEAIKFINDIESEEFNSIENNYYKSIELIESNNYKEAIKLLEDIDAKRSGLVEVNEMLSLLYMIEKNEYMAFDKIRILTNIDKSNEKLSLIYENIEADIQKRDLLKIDESEEFIGRFTISEVILNLVMILNYKINDIYESEYKNKNDELLVLKKLLENKELEIEKLKVENKEAFDILEEVRFRNESAYTEELDD